MNKYAKFGLLIVIVVGTVTWLAMAGMGETKTYYKTISELSAMGQSAYGKKIRVGGDVAAGSIHRVGNEVQFVLKQDKQQLKVSYTGSDPLPDTFRDGAQALADGRLMADGGFQAAKVQAKCASKYEAKPTAAPSQLPVNAGRT